MSPFALLEITNALLGLILQVEYLFRILGELGQRLGVVLFQLPPNLKKDIDRLHSFMALIPKGATIAMEFRHESWFTDEVLECLRDRKSALVLSEDDDVAAEVVPTADWGYLRLRKDNYDDDDLRDWLEKLGAQNWNESFVFFKHEGAGTGPELAERLLQLSEG